MSVKMEVGKKYRDESGTVWECVEYKNDGSLLNYRVETDCDLGYYGKPNSWWARPDGKMGGAEGPQLMEIEEDPAPAEYTGGSVNYYRVPVKSPTSGGDPYEAECNDIIEALKMNYAEGNAFKAIWRSCAARKLGLAKKFYDDGLYDAEKVVFFGGRMVVQAKEQ